jgi:hypothetical protein
MATPGGPYPDPFAEAFADALRRFAAGVAPPARPVLLGDVLDYHAAHGNSELAHCGRVSGSKWTISSIRPSTA